MTQAEQLAVLEDLARPEPLRPELTPYVRDGPLGKMFHHPLHIEILFDPARAARINARVPLIEAKCAEVLAAGEYDRYVFCHERPYRVEALDRVAAQMPSDAYWPLVGSVWVDSENVWQNLDTWRSLLWPSERPVTGRPLMMDDEEREALAALPDELIVYRGCTRRNRRGLSWTLDEAKAKWFAQRFATVQKMPPLVMRGRVRKDKVIAHFTGRNEDEIVADPADVKIQWK